LLGVAVVGLAGRARLTRLGRLGGVIAGLGILLVPVSFILTEWFQLEAWLLILAGLLSHAGGLIIFGLSNWRQPLNKLALVLGLGGGVLPLVLTLLNSQSNWPALILGYGLGLGWVLVGVLLLMAGRPAGSRTA
jgi:NAD/NADP transhydrogenase beta subunit